MILGTVGNTFRVKRKGVLVQMAASVIESRASLCVMVEGVEFVLAESAALLVAKLRGDLVLLQPGSDARHLSGSIQKTCQPERKLLAHREFHLVSEDI